MQGLFHNTEDHLGKYHWDERDGEVNIYRNVRLEQDLGPFGEGELVDWASYNTLTGKVTLEQLGEDPDDDETKIYTFTVWVNYVVLPVEEE